MKRPGPQEADNATFAAIVTQARVVRQVSLALGAQLSRNPRDAEATLRISRTYERDRAALVAMSNVMATYTGYTLETILSEAAKKAGGAS